MTESTQCFRYEDYTVGWIAAIPVELQAAMEMLDQRHYDLPQNPNSSTIYTLGSIGPHKVVMACLSVDRTGIGSAAAIATEMRTIFPCLRFGLLVGVGGGVPSTADVRLGDVVVSQPRASRDGVIQYDFGKNTTSGFQRTIRLSPPPDILLNALSNYQARNLDPDGDLVSHQFKPKQMHAMLHKFPAPDMLFRANYDHVGGKTCKSCDPAQLSKPPERDDRCIMVHYGTIASGNQVIKDGTKRDQLSNELGEVLCFEMEAAGIMNTFPSLVIRGICDYADSHKNKYWQRFAAQAAAAYSKEFLDIVPPMQSLLMPEVAEMTKSLKKFRISNSSTRTRNTSADFRNEWSGYSDLVKYEFTIQSISDYDPLRTYRDFARGRCPGTTQWILEHETYLQWGAAEDSNCLWLTGKIGSGKTLVTSTVIEQLLQDFEDDNGLVLHYFYRHSHKADLSAIAFLKSCIKQILIYLESTNRSCPPAIEAYLRSHHGSNKNSGSFDEMVENAFTPLASTIDGIMLVIDGLDECDNKEIQEVLKVVRDFLKGPHRKVFISGRVSLDIGKSVPGSSCIHISEEDAASDISGYIRWKLDEKMLERQIVDDRKILAEIEAILLENAEQMILWVKLQIENIWEDCSGDAEIRAALKNLPKDLTETYNRCFKRIFSDKGIYSRGYAAKILPWMLEAVKPLTMTQLRQALAIDPDSGTISHGMMPSIQDTIRSCANLVIQNTDQQVVLAHHSIYQYLKDRIQVQEHETGDTYKQDPEMPQLSTTITLARLCIEHLLSKDYTLAVQRLGKDSTLRLGLPEINRLTAVIPRSIRPFLPQPKPIQVTVQHPPPKSTSIVTLPDFFHYAREQWAELTRDWNVHNDCYPKFANLALNPNLTWRLHPWKPLGQSLDSHYFGLLGWAIVNRHQPLFQLLFVDPDSPLREHLYTAPFHPYDGLNCVLLAARSDTPWVFDYIPKTCLSGLLKSRDHNGWTALHYAVDVRSTITVIKLRQLVRNLHVPISNNGFTALEFAATKGYSEMVEILLRDPEFARAEVVLKATVAAITNGHASLLNNLLPISKVISTGADEIKRAILNAAASGHWAVIDSVSDLTTLRSGALTSGILSAAIHSNQIDELGAIDISDTLSSEDTLIWFANKIVEINDPVKYLRWFTMVQEIPNLMHSGYPETTDLLHIAIKNNSPQQVDVLLTCGQDYRQIFRAGETALQIALFAGQYDIVKVLVKHQAFGRASHGQLMDAAIKINDLNLAKYLIQHGISLMALYPRYERWTTFLHEASMAGSDEMFALLLEAADKWLYTDNYGKTVLILAAKAGHTEKVKLLCKLLHGKDGKDYINRRDSEGRTAFFHSCIQGNYACAKVLQEYGANVMIPNQKGSTILQAMVQLPFFKSRLSLGFESLIKSKLVDVNMRDRTGATALHTAVLSPDRGVIDILSSLGADVNIQDKAGNTALHLAIMYNRLNDVKDLMAAGALATIENNIGYTAVGLSMIKPEESPVRYVFIDLLPGQLQS